MYKLALIWKHFKLVSYVAEVWKLNIPKHFFLFIYFFLGSPNAGLAVTPPVKPQVHRAWAGLWLFDFYFLKIRLSICTNNAQLWRVLRFIFLPWGTLRKTTKVFFLTLGSSVKKKTLVVSVLCIHVACCKIYLCFTKTTTQLNLEGVRGRPPCEKNDKHTSWYYLENFWYLFQIWALDVHVSVCEWFSL